MLHVQNVVTRSSRDGGLRVEAWWAAGSWESGHHLKGVAQAGGVLPMQHQGEGGEHPAAATGSSLHSPRPAMKSGEWRVSGDLGMQAVRRSTMTSPGSLNLADPCGDAVTGHMLLSTEGVDVAWALTEAACATTSRQHGGWIPGVRLPACDGTEWVLD